MSLRQCFELTRDAGFDGIELVLVEAPIEDNQGTAGGAEHLALPMTYLGFHPHQNNEFTLESTEGDVGYDGWVTAEITPPAPHYPAKVIYDISTTMDWIMAGGQPD